MVCVLDSCEGIVTPESSGVHAAFVHAAMSHSYAPCVTLESAVCDGEVPCDSEAACVSPIKAKYMIPT